MRKLFGSHFFVRFAGGFVLGAIATLAMHSSAVAHDLSASVQQIAHLV